MGNFKNKKLSKKLILSVLIVLIFLGTILPNISNAEAKEASQGGKLLQPVVDLLLTLGDGIMDIIQKTVMGTSGHISLDIAISRVIKIIGILAGIVAAIGVIAIAATGVGAVVEAIAGAAATAAVSVGGAVVSVVTAGAVIAGVAGYSLAVDVLSGAFLPDITILPLYQISPEEIFAGKILLFDTNFFNPKKVMAKYRDKNGEDHSMTVKAYEDKLSKEKEDSGNNLLYYYYVNSNGEEVPTSKQNTALELSSNISKWYYTIRNMALIFMMLILAYIGIRMMVSSVASEKSKYKKMLSDWVVSMCLMFVLQYIMVFAVNINEDLISIVRTTVSTKQDAVVIDLNKEMKNKDEFIKAVEEADNGDLLECFTNAQNEPVKTYTDEDGRHVSDKNEAVKFSWMTNLLGRFRLCAQLQNGSSEYVGYGIAYLVMVGYTIFFSFTYLKRVLYLAFLTVIAPLVAMTYSIDRIADGKAQAFNMWFKEYIFNLLIQPMHLILYLLLITMAFDLASINILYSLVALGFIVPAEKFIRKMFGFEKAQTPGLLGGAAGAALAVNGMKRLGEISRGKGGKDGNGQFGNSGANTNSNPVKIRTADSGRGLDALTSDIQKNESPQITANVNSNSGTNTFPVSGGPSASDANSNFNLKDPENPVTRMEREALEEKLADGQITPNELSDAQKRLLGMSVSENPMSRMEREALEEKIADGQITPDELSDEQKVLLGINSNYQQEEPPSTDEEQQDSEEIDNDKTKKEKYDELERQAQEKSPKATLKRMGARAVQSVTSKENLKRNLGNAAGIAIKSGSRVLGSAVGVGVGAAMGIASGDITKIGQYGAVGYSAGKAVGTVGGNAITKGGAAIGSGAKSVKTGYQKEKYGAKYDQYQKEKEDKKFMKDREARDYYAKQFSDVLSQQGSKEERKQKLNEIMEQATEYRREGVTDNAIIARAMKLNKDKPTSNESKLAAVVATKANDIKGLEPYQKQIASKLGDKKASEITNHAAKLKGFYT